MFGQLRPAFWAAMRLPGAGPSRDGARPTRMVLESMEEYQVVTDRPSAAEPVDDLPGELRRANEKLQRSFKRVEAILQSIGDCVAVADEHGKLQLFNAAAEELLGLGPTDEPAGQWSSTYGIFLPDGETLCPTEQLPLVRAVRGEQVSRMELVIRSPRHETPISILARAQPIRDDDGFMCGGVVVFHDISEQKRAEEEILRARDDLEARVAERTADLRDSEARYHDLYDNAPDMFLSVDVLTTRVIHCNRTLLTTTGLEPNQIVQRSVFDLFDAVCLQKARRAFRTFARTGQATNIDLLLRRQDGGVIDVSLSVSALRDSSGQITHGRFVMRDISERKLAERQIRRQQEELTHVTRLSTMGEMAAGLAHEINQPLTAIAAFAEGTRARIGQGSARLEDCEEMFDRIAADAHRAGAIIRRLRRFVKKRETHRESLDINDAVCEVCRFVHSEAAQEEAEIDLRLAEGLPQVPADAVEVQQVVLNLVRNALDAMRDAGSADRRIFIETFKNHNQGVGVVVQDTGPGLSPGLQEQVFEQFFTSKDEGLGMGLAISRSIIEAHGGRIWFASPPKGARVHFTLPSRAVEADYA